MVAYESANFMKAEDCILVVLAAGLSVRFGEADKLMAELNGKPVLRHVIDNMASLPFAARFAVVSTETAAKVNTNASARRSLLAHENYALSIMTRRRLGKVIRSHLQRIKL